MPKTRIPSPARSQGAPVTPRRQKSRTRSVGSPARSNASGRLSTVIDQFREINKDSFAVSPLGKTVLNDDTDIEQPRRASWWKRVDQSRVVSEVLDTNTGAVNNVLDELDIEVLSQEKKDYTMDLPESSDSESISSIVIPQRKLFSQKENLQQNRYREIVKTRESLAKQNKTIIADNTATETGPRNLFNKAPKRTKPIFPAALLNFSPDKTVNKTKDLPAEVKGEARNLFGNRPGTKRKNMFADFILSESEDDISEIQPKLFAFQKNSAPVRHSTVRPRESSPTSSVTTDIEMDDWHLLPSSTMVEHQIEALVGTTPRNRTRLSKLSEAKESTVANSTANKTKHSNKSASKNHGNDDLNEIAKERTNVSLKGELKAQVEVVTEDHEKQHDNIETSEKISNKSKAINKYVEETPKPTEEEDVTSIQETSKETELEIDENAEIDAEVHEKMDVSDHEEEGDNQAVPITENEIEANEKQINKNYNYEKKVDEIETSEHVVDNRMEDNKLEVDEKEMAEQTIKDQEIKDNKQDMDQEVEDDKQDMDQEIENDKKETAEEAIEDEEIKNDKQEVDEQEIPEQAVDDQETTDNEEEADNQETEVSEQDMDDEQVEEEEMVLQMEDEDEIENGNYEIEQEVTDNEEQNESHEVNDENQDEENNSQEVHDQSSSIGADVENDEEDEQIESNNEEEIQNESQNIENESQEIDDDQVENDDDEQEAEEKESSDEEQDESRELLNESQEQEVENTSQEIQEESDEENDAEIQNDSAEVEEENNEKIQDESQAEINNESQEINDDDQEEIQNESEELSDGDQEDNEQDDQETGEQETEEQETEELQETESETPNVSHDTTGRNRKKTLESPEAVLNEVTNQINSFTTKGRNTSIIKTKSIFKTKHSLAPVTESTRLSDGTKNSSAEGSGWDSHRTTRKTLRQTFGRDFTPRKSLRAMVMEKSAKRQTAVNEANAALNLQEAANVIPPEDAQEEEEMECDDNVGNVENIEESDREVSKRTRQTTLEMYLQKIKKENIERNLKIEEQVKNSFKFNPHRRDFLNRIPPKPIRRTAKPLQIAPKKRLKPSVISLEDLPPELVEDMKYKPPKRYQPGNAAWITKRLYKFLESKLEPVYDYKARVRAEKLVEMMYNFARDTRRERVAAPHAVAELEREMARLGIVRTHFDFYNFCHDYLPLEVKIKVVPDIVNEIPMPRNGVFGDIMDGH